MPRQQFQISPPLILLSMSFYLLLLPFIQYPLTTVLKPIPIIFLILLTLQVSPKSEIKALLITALGFSLMGDIILTLPIKAALQAGIVAFMLTHCAYISLFLKNAPFQRKHLTSFLPMLILVGMVFYYLWPYLGEMQKPITIYLCLLISMVFCAFQVKQHRLLIASGASLFLLSDFALALNQFVLSNNRSTAVLVMLLYYAARVFAGNGHHANKNSLGKAASKLNY